MAEAAVEVIGKLTNQDIDQYCKWLDPDAFEEMSGTFLLEKRTRLKTFAYLKGEHPVLFRSLESIEAVTDGAARAIEGIHAAFLSAKEQRASAAYYEDQLRMPPAKRKIRDPPVRAEDTEAAFEPEKKKTWAPKEEPWSDAHKVNDFYIYRTRTHPVVDDDWVTLHHCESEWSLESLVELLQDQGHWAIGLKAYKVPADLDMLRWKVVSNSPVT